MAKLSRPLDRLRKSLDGIVSDDKDFDWETSFPEGVWGTSIVTEQGIFIGVGFAEKEKRDQFKRTADQRARSGRAVFADRLRLMATKTDPVLGLTCFEMGIVA